MEQHHQVAALGLTLESQNFLVKFVGGFRKRFVNSNAGTSVKGSDGDDIGRAGDVSNIAAKNGGMPGRGFEELDYCQNWSGPFQYKDQGTNRRTVLLHF